MAIKRFEDFDAWIVARELTSSIYKALPPKKDWGFWDQITRSAISVMNNIAEGFESGTDKEFLRYLGYAKSSCGEVRSMIYVGLDVGYFNEKTFQDLLSKSKQISGAVFGMMRYLRGEETRRRKG